MPDATLLRIDSIDFVDWAVRGITMTIEPIDQDAQFARDCRGELVHLSPPQFRKHKFSIQCTDQAAPDFTDVWGGHVVNIDCIPNMGEVNSTDGVLSFRAMVMKRRVSGEEYAASVAWQLDGEEI